MAHPRDRRASRRNQIQVRMDMSDTRGSFTGRSVDVSRGGIFAATSETRPVGTLLHGCMPWLVRLYPPTTRRRTLLFCIPK